MEIKAIESRLRIELVIIELVTISPQSDGTEESDGHADTD